MKTTTQTAEPIVTIGDLRRDKSEESIFVFNNSRRDGEPAGEILFSVRVGDESVAIKVENTWIPIDLADYAPKNAVLNSPQFLKAVNQRLLRLTTRDKAENILQTEDAQTEYDRLRILRGNYDPKTLGDKKKAQQNQQEEIAAKILADQRARKLAEGSGFDSGVNAQVVSLMNRQEFDGKAKQMALRNIENDLTEGDLHYVFTRAKVEEEGLKNWAKERLDLFKGN